MLAAQADKCEGSVGSSAGCLYCQRMYLLRPDLVLGQLAARSAGSCSISLFRRIYWSRPGSDAPVLACSAGALNAPDALTDAEQRLRHAWMDCGQLVSHAAAELILCWVIEKQLLCPHKRCVDFEHGVKLSLCSRTSSQGQAVQPATQYSQIWPSRPCVRPFPGPSKRPAGCLRHPTEPHH